MRILDRTFFKAVRSMTMNWDIIVKRMLNACSDYIVVQIIALRKLHVISCSCCIGFVCLVPYGHQLPKLYLVYISSKYNEHSYKKHLTKVMKDVKVLPDRIKFWQNNYHFTINITYFNVSHMLNVRVRVSMTLIWYMICTKYHLWNYG